MRKRFQFAIFLAAVALPGPSCAEVLDRVAVTVDNHVITQSALHADLRITAFLDHARPDFSSHAMRRAAERLVDQILILREATDSHILLPDREDAEVLLEQVKAEYTAQETFEEQLGGYEIIEEELRTHLLAGLRALTFSDLRFRGGIQISDEELQQRYQEFFGPASDAAARGAGTGSDAIPSFEESREELQELVTNERVLAALESWLASTRGVVRIEYREEAFR